MCTGYSTPELEMEAIEFGADFFVPKPFEVEELIDIVKKSLRLSKEQ
jgi:DNA-binding response OmpR family regulator